MDQLTIKVNPYKKDQYENEFLWNNDNLNNIEFSQFKVWENTDVMRIINEILIAVYDYKNTRTFAVSFIGVSDDSNIVKEAIAKLNEADFKIELLNDNNMVIEPFEKISLLRMVIIGVQGFIDFIDQDRVQQLSDLRERVEIINEKEANSIEVVKLTDKLLAILDEKTINAIDDNINRVIEVMEKELERIKNDKLDIEVKLRKINKVIKYCNDIEFSINQTEFMKEKAEIDEEIDALNNNIQESIKTKGKKNKEVSPAHEITKLKIGFILKIDNALKEALVSIHGDVGLANSLSKDDEFQVNQFIPSIDIDRRFNKKLQPMNDNYDIKFTDCLNEIAKIQMEFNIWYGNETTQLQEKLYDLEKNLTDCNKKLLKFEGNIETSKLQIKKLSEIKISMASLRDFVK